jgi:hypothetical protein
MASTEPTIFFHGASNTLKYHQSRSISTNATPAMCPTLNLPRNLVEAFAQASSVRQRIVLRFCDVPKNGVNNDVSVMLPNRCSQSHTCNQSAISVFTLLILLTRSLSFATAAVGCNRSYAYNRSSAYGTNGLEVEEECDSNSSYQHSRILLTIDRVHD